MRWNRSVNTGTLTWRQTAGVSLVVWSSSCAAINKQVTGPIQFLSSGHLPGSWSYHLSPMPRFKMNVHLKKSSLGDMTPCKYPRNGGSKLLQSVRNTSIQVSCPWGPASSPAPLWKPQISQVKFFLSCLHAFIVQYFGRQLLRCILTIQEYV